MGILWSALCRTCVLCALFLFLIAPNLGRRKTVRNALEQALFAHRGLHGGLEKLPENSLEAFEKAAEAGYGVEMDVRTTSDGHLIVFHDATLKRLFGRDERIDQMTLSEIREMRLGGNQKIPTLKEALTVLRGRAPLLLEIKSRPFRNRGIAPKVRDCMQEYKGVFCVESFDPMVLLYFRLHAPEIFRSQLMGAPGGEKSPHTRLFTGLCLLTCFISRPDVIAYPVSGERNLIFRMMRSVFRPVTAAWTVRSKEEFKRIRPRCDLMIFESFIPETNWTIHQEKENEP